MDKIKELTDFYMWMQENDYDHNIRARVERKAEMYLNGINVGQKLPIQNVVEPKGKFYCGDKEGGDCNNYNFGQCKECKEKENKQ